ncbi:MAG: hypothetical protein N2255_03425 [Kiritimatiellae bacterium]|nr:hypothetical protein [Kiritimatiellia bacterium]
MNPIIRRFVQDVGNATQSFGVGRVIGQIYAFLYFSREPKNLTDIAMALGISKGSVSMGVRQLEQWGAVRKVWVKGDRKDYYEANDWLGRILKTAVLDTVGKKLAAYRSLLDGVEAQLAHLSDTDGEGRFIRERVEHLRRFHGRLQKLWQNPIVQTLLE